MIFGSLGIAKISLET